MATHSSFLAWEIPWTEEPGGLQSMWSQRVNAPEHSAHTHIIITRSCWIYSLKLHTLKEFPVTTATLREVVNTTNFNEKTVCRGVRRVKGDNK